MTDASIVIEPESRSAWRAWLTRNHATRKTVRIVIVKKGSKEAKLTLHEAQEEALCFGWVDVKNRRIDDERYTLQFAPRRPGSAWSASNIERVERLERAGLMKQEGRRSVLEAKANGQWELALKIEQTDEIPPELQRALAQRRGALDGYRRLAHSRKKQILRRYLTAKGEATRERIVNAVVREVLVGT